MHLKPQHFFNLHLQGQEILLLIFWIQSFSKSDKMIVSKDLKLLRHVSERILALFLDGKFHIFTKYAFPCFIHLCVTIPIKPDHMRFIRIHESYNVLYFFLLIISTVSIGRHCLNKGGSWSFSQCQSAPVVRLSWLWIVTQLTSARDTLHFIITLKLKSYSVSL